MIRASVAGRRGVAAVIAGGVCALAASCGGAASTTTDHAAAISVAGGHGRLGQLSVSGAYIPAPATPSLAAAYFTVTDAGPSDRLVAVTTTTARRSSLHRYVSTSDGAERMVPVQSAVVPAGGSVAFSPGSYHVMLQRPVHPLRKGMTVLLTLHFAKAGELTIRVPVVAATGLVSAGQTMSGMDMG